jgi:hypothetical protein
MRLACNFLAREINRRGGAHQYGRYAILRRALRSRVTTYADALLAAAKPEPSALLAQNGALFIEQRKTDGLVGGGAHEE